MWHRVPVSRRRLLFKSQRSDGIYYIRSILIDLRFVSHRQVHGPDGRDAQRTGDVTVTVTNDSRRWYGRWFRAAAEEGTG